MEHTNGVTEHCSKRERCGNSKYNRKFKRKHERKFNRKYNRNHTEPDDDRSGVV